MGFRRFYRFAVVARVICAIGLLFAAPVASGAADKPLRGVALIVGNGAYGHLAPLANPVDDARAISALFDDLGFETTLVRDVDARKLARTIGRFVEDAEGADAAVVYYSGHGIEAGGENWLIPTDADFSSLADATASLAPLSRLVQDLGKSVPLTIVLLDACRDNPFPAGAAFRVSPDTEPMAVSAAGLGETRSVARFGNTAATIPAEAVGTLVGFAAAPGQVALDGEPGANSPYAAAVLRHLSAMTGEEFGTVMRMVAEEVYLKTGGRQRPWVNESLRKLLHFGAAPKPVKGEEGAILNERRQLLLTIAALPDLERRQVERVAGAGGVPMDALYGMLKAMGQEAPSDPAKLEAILRGQTERLKEMMAQRAALVSTDAEILRLWGLADRAISEGALASAIRLNEAAKARVGALHGALASAEAALKARHLEFAEVYARSGRAYALAADDLAAAEDYDRAFGEAERWDDALAWRYRMEAVRALYRYGENKADRTALERALGWVKDAGRLADRLPDRLPWAKTQTNLGNVLAALGLHEPGVARLDAAVAAFKAAIAVLEPAGDDATLALARINLANTLSETGRRTDDLALLQASVEAYDAALAGFDNVKFREEWAIAQYNRGLSFRLIGELTTGTDALVRSIDAFTSTLPYRPRETRPREWSMTLSSLAITRALLGWRQRDPAVIRQGIAETALALQEATRERMPITWARGQHSMANAWLMVVDLENAVEPARAALANADEALRVYTRDSTPFEWAGATHDRGTALREIAVRTGDLPMAHSALAAYREALTVHTKKDVPSFWAATEYRIAQLSLSLGDAEQDFGLLDEAVAAYAGLADYYRETGVPGFRAELQNSMGHALNLAARSDGDIRRYERAVGILREAAATQAQSNDQPRLATTQDTLCEALTGLARARRDTALAAEAVAACTASAAELRARNLADLLAIAEAHLAAAVALAAELAR